MSHAGSRTNLPPEISKLPSAHSLGLDTRRSSLESNKSAGSAFSSRSSNGHSTNVVAFEGGYVMVDDILGVSEHCVVLDPGHLDSPIDDRVAADVLRKQKT